MSIFIRKVKIAPKPTKETAKWLPLFKNYKIYLVLKQFLPKPFLSFFSHMLVYLYPWLKCLGTPFHYQHWYPYCPRPLLALLPFGEEGLWYAEEDVPSTQAVGRQLVFSRLLLTFLPFGEEGFSYVVEEDAPSTQAVGRQLVLSELQAGKRGSPACPEEERVS